MLLETFKHATRYTPNSHEFNQVNNYPNILNVHFQIFLVEDAQIDCLLLKTLPIRFLAAEFLAQWETNQKYI